MSVLFNFIVADASSARVMALEDTLRPLVWGLREAGHRVIAFNHSFKPFPAINLLVGGGMPEIVAPYLLRARREAGEDVCVGLLAPDDIAPEPEPQALLPLIEAGVVRFLWSCAGAVPITGGLPAASLSFGFHPALLGTHDAPDDRREVGVVLYGRETPYRAALAARLTEAVPQFLFVRPGHFPDYIVGDLLRRAALVIVSRGDEHDGSAPQARIAKALCSGTAVIDETGAGPAPLGGYTTSCSYVDIPERCRAAISAGGAAKAGPESLARFRAGPGMSRGLEAAIALAMRAIAA